MEFIFLLITIAAFWWAWRWLGLTEKMQDGGLRRLILIIVISFVTGFATLQSSTGGAVGVVIGLGVWYLVSRKKDSKREGRVRGGVVVQSNELEKLAAKEDPSAQIFIGSVGVPRGMENRHFLLSGSTGSGKSQAFYQLAEAARKRGDGAIVADVNAEMLCRFYDEGRGDVILNPLDRRSKNWSPLAEISGLWDADRIAKSLIPTGEGSAAEWNHYAQVLLSAVLAKTWQDDGKNFDLTNLLLVSPNEDLSKSLAGTQAAQLFAPGAERMLSSIRAITATYCQPLSYLSPVAGRDGFSITRFVQQQASNASARPWLFFPVRDDFFKSFRSLIAGQVDIAISSLLSANDDDSRRVWFMLDEFATWGRISSITDLLTKARKKGGVGALGLQSISQIRETYGREGAQTLLANLGNWLTLRAGDAETAEFMSKNIGDEQIRRMNESVNAEGQKSSSEQIALQRVVLPAELQNLPDLAGILNIAGPLPAGWIKVPISSLARKNPGFELIQSS